MTIILQPTDDLVTILKHIKHVLSASLFSERTRLSISAMEFCQKIALLLKEINNSNNNNGSSNSNNNNTNINGNNPNSNINANGSNGRDEFILELICSILFKLCERTNKIFQQKAQQTLLVFMNSLPYHQSFWFNKTLECMTNPSKSLRTISMDLFVKLIESEINNLGESSIMEKIITLGLADASPSVRESSRHAFTIMDPKFPKMANSIYSNSNSITQKLLRRPGEENSSTLFEKRPSILKTILGTGNEPSLPLPSPSSSSSLSTASTYCSAIRNPIAVNNSVATGTGMVAGTGTGGLVGASRVLKSSLSASNVGSATKKAQRVITTNTNASTSAINANVNATTATNFVTLLPISRPLLSKSMVIDSYDNQKSNIANGISIPANLVSTSTSASAPTSSSSSSLKDQFNLLISDSKSAAWNQRQKSFEELSTLIPSLLLLNNSRLMIIRLLEVLIVGLGDLHFKVLQAVLQFGFGIFNNIQIDLISLDLIELVIVRLEMILGNIQFKPKTQIIEGSQQLLGFIFQLLSPEKLLLLLSGAMLKSDAATSSKLRSNLLGHLGNVLLKNATVLQIDDHHHDHQQQQQQNEEGIIATKNEGGIPSSQTRLILNRCISILGDTEVVNETLEVIGIMERIWPKTIQTWSETCKVPQIKQLVMDYINKQKTLEKPKKTTLITIIENQDQQVIDEKDEKAENETKKKIVNEKLETINEEMTIKKVSLPSLEMMQVDDSHLGHNVSFPSSDINVNATIIDVDDSVEYNVKENELLIQESIDSNNLLSNNDNDNDDNNKDEEKKKEMIHMEEYMNNASNGIESFSSNKEHENDNKESENIKNEPFVFSNEESNIFSSEYHYEEETTEHRLLVKEIVSRLSGEMMSPSIIHIQPCGEIEDGEIIEFGDHVPVEQDNSEIYIRKNMKKSTPTTPPKIGEMPLTTSFHQEITINKRESFLKDKDLKETGNENENEVEMVNIKVLNIKEKMEINIDNSNNNNNDNNNNQEMNEQEIAINKEHF